MACPTGKKPHATYAEALAAHMQVNSDGLGSVYVCPYCDGWHVVMLVGFGDPTAFQGGNAELFDFLSEVDIQFVLDGVPLETERTSVRRFPHPEPEFFENPQMALTFGAFMAPGELALGSHELRTTYHEPGFDLEFTIGFSVVAC